jgi:Fe-S-cluster containining protein
LTHATERPLSDLCAACGLCCNGTLYSYVTLLDQEEVDALKKHDPNIAFLLRNGMQTFDQPCKLHNGTGCTGYLTRPDTCSRYSCALLRAVAADDVTPFEALATIQEAKALVENVKEYVDFEPGRPLAASTWEAAPDDAPEEGRLAWERARDWLVKHFIGPDPSAVKSEPVVEQAQGWVAPPDPALVIAVKNGTDPRKRPLRKLPPEPELELELEADKALDPLLAPQPELPVVL